MIRARPPQDPTVQQSEHEAVPARAASAAAAPFRDVFQAQFDYVWHTLRRLGVPERDWPT
ncbi:MAG: hypothetical protein QM756_05215 [Polyangiaceae bacterium]